MEPRNARLTARIASELALVGALTGALFEGATGADPFPGLALLVVWAAAPALAVAETWWVPSRRVRIPILALTVAIELPAIATGAVAMAIVVEALLLAALIATPFDRRAPLAQYEHRRLSVVL
jgi:hypothetical protein